MQVMGSYVVFGAECLSATLVWANKLTCLSALPPVVSSSVNYSLVLEQLTEKNPFVLKINCCYVFI